MKTIKEKLAELTEDSVWVFAKQETNFDRVFEATKVFASISDKTNVNIESYFSENSPWNHRMLSSAQLYGLITKTPFNGKKPYSNETVTAAFNALNSCEFGSERYNQLKTEQLLKYKIRAVIETAGKNIGYNVLPIIFTYNVLRKLKEKHSINKLPLELFHIYIMTCRGFDEVDDIVDILANNPPSKKNLYKKYYGLSRVPNTFYNISLFSFDGSFISLNPKFDDYFHNNFISKFDMNSWQTNYEKFLYNVQGFRINLVDEDAESEEDEGENYSKEVDSVKESEINETLARNAHKAKPVVSATKTGTRIKTNPEFGKLSIKRAEYRCIKDISHGSFLSRKSGKPYMEAHHLIPTSYYEYIWTKYGVSVDCPENIISLCPTCHKAIHYGTKEVQSHIIEDLFGKYEKILKSVGLNVSLEELKGFYGIIA